MHVLLGEIVLSCQNGSATPSVLITVSLSKLWGLISSFSAKYVVRGALPVGLSTIGRNVISRFALNVNPVPPYKNGSHEHFLIHKDACHNYIISSDTCGAKCSKCFLRCVERNMNLHVVVKFKHCLLHQNHRHFLTHSLSLVLFSSREQFLNITALLARKKEICYALNANLQLILSLGTLG